MATEAIYQHMCSKSDQWIGITILVLGLSSNLLLILKNITTVIVITHRGHSRKRIIYAQMIIIYILIYNKHFCDGGVRIKSEVSGDKLININKWLLVWGLIFFVGVWLWLRWFLKLAPLYITAKNRHHGCLKRIIV